MGHRKTASARQVSGEGRIKTAGMTLTQRRTSTEIGRTFVIAEAGVNHNGDPRLARRLVETAAEAGVDAVKFQTFHASRLVSPNAPKADYQVAATGDRESQFEMLQDLELPPEEHQALRDLCGDLGIEFMSTPFDAESAEFLVKEIGIRRLKVGSGEVTNGPFLMRLAQFGLPVILSTGMSNLDEIGQALIVLAHGYSGALAPPNFDHGYGDEVRARVAGRVTLLQCTTEYPAPYSEINLRTMNSLAERFGLPVGLSDHSPGIEVPVAAVAMGAVVIEKHLTLDRSLPGPDHRASLEPSELRDMIRSIRNVEQALGDGHKAPTASEQRNISIVRRSLVAAREISAGEPFSEQNLSVKRPGTGASPMHYWEYLGTAAKRSYEKDELIE